MVANDRSASPQEQTGRFSAALGHIATAARAIAGYPQL
jgi:hypothetical protein